MKLKDFKTTAYLLIIMVKLRFIVYKSIGVQVLKKYHPMAIIIASIWLHFKLMVFTLIYFYLSNKFSSAFALFTSLSLTFLITLLKIIHATYLKERKEVEMTYFRHLEEESKNTPLNGSATKH